MQWSPIFAGDTVEVCVLDLDGDPFAETIVYSESGVTDNGSTMETTVTGPTDGVWYSWRARNDVHVPPYDKATWILWDGFAGEDLVEGIPVPTFPDKAGVAIATSFAPQETKIYINGVL